MKNKLHQIFYRIYGHNRPIRTFFSPGRVNLIGEHIDYNGGYVFPTALSIGTYGAIALRDDLQINLYSENFKNQGIISVSLHDLVYRKEHGWANYPKGVILELINQGYSLNQGFDIAIFGDLPNSSGLSSSASIECLIAVMMNDLFHLNIARPTLAVLCKQVENHYIGVNCGIMDQFIIANGIENHGLLLDCQTLAFTPVELYMQDYSIVICNSKVKRGLVDSKYNERRDECERALKVFQNHLSIENLCDMSLVQFETFKDYLNDEILLKRSRHAVTENQRAVAAVKQFQDHNLFAFGQAMNQSHLSLKNDYEVSCDELDVLVELALKNGAIGSRMTGAGFGGCTVNIVKTDTIHSFKEAVLKGYFDRFGIQGEIYEAIASDGTKEIE